MERVEQIKEKVEALVNEAIAILEKNYDMDDTRGDTDSQAYMIMMDLNGALMNLCYLDEDALKTEE